MEYLKDYPFLEVCSKGTVEEIKNFVASYGYDRDDRNDELYKDGSDGLHYACRFNKNPGVIKYLLEDLNIKMFQNKNAQTVFMIACAYCSLDDVKFIASYIKHFEHHTSNNVRLYYKDTDFYDASIHACAHNTLDVVKYLVEELNFKCSTDLKNGFVEACKSSQHIDILEYLLYKFPDNNITYRNGSHIVHHDRRHEGLLVACYFNNILIVKYLVENHNLLSTKEHRENILERACYDGTNDEVVRYLLDETICILALFEKHNRNSHDKCIQRLLKIKHPVLSIYNVYKWPDDSVEYTTKVTNAYNYILSNKRYELLIPLQSTFHYIDNHINALEYDVINEVCTYIESNHIKKDSDVTQQSYNFTTNVDIYLFKTPFSIVNGQLFDMTIEDNLNDITFKCNFIYDDAIVDYYCSRWWICHVIPTFKKMIDFGGIESVERVINLKLEISKRVFDAYIIACHTGRLIITECNIDDILQFIQLMDMYPNVMFSIHDVEPKMIELLDKDPDNASKVKYVCDCYKLKETRIKQKNILVYF